MSGENGGQLSEKLPFLKREDIRTMNKDVARLQEEQALSQRENLARLQVEEKQRQVLFEKETEREKVASTMIPKEGKVAEVKAKVEQITSAKNKMPPAVEKVLVRLVLIILLIGFILLLGFGYWFLNTKVFKPQVSPTPLPIPSPTMTPEQTTAPSPTPETIIPKALIPMAKTKVMEVAPEAKLKDLLAENLKALDGETKNGEFVQIVFKKENGFYNARDFFNGLGLTIPAAIIDGLNQTPDDFTLFVYRQTAGWRLGFLVKTKENLGQEFLDWEKEMERVWSDFFGLMGKTKPALAKVFRDAQYLEEPFRFQTFNLNDLGICYAFFNDKLVFTSSAESLKKVFDLLKANP
jgi:hypothetical protein